MTPQQNVRFLVLDAMDSPGEGQILRLRLEAGEASLKSIKGAQLNATGPNGDSLQLNVTGFALVGGKPSEGRFSRTGRVDVHASPVDGSHDKVGLQWEVTLG